MKGGEERKEKEKEDEVREERMGKGVVYQGVVGDSQAAMVFPNWM